MTGFDLSNVDEALAAVLLAQSQLHEAQLLLGSATDELNDQIVLHGMDVHSAGEVVDHALIRRLYWDAPSISTRGVSRAFGLRSSNDVCLIAGPKEFRLPCQVCGDELTHQVKNRTELAKLRSSNLCNPCEIDVADRARRRRAELDEEWRRRSNRDADVVKRAMQEYVLAHPELPAEPPEGMTLFVDIPVAEWGGTTVDLRDLHLVRRELAARLSVPIERSW